MYGPWRQSVQVESHRHDHVAAISREQLLEWATLKNGVIELLRAALNAALMSTPSFYFSLFYNVDLEGFEYFTLCKIPKIFGILL